MESPHLEYIYSLDRLGIKPGLERMQAMMELLGHPEQQFKSIHISGTNGKGSVAAMIESVLRHTETHPTPPLSPLRPRASRGEAGRGFKTGLYTSPDIYSFHERIRVDGEPISDEVLAKLVWEVKEVAEKHNVQLTFFEFGTVVCYLLFDRQKVDIAVVEVGMGGLLDATNVITPIMSVITNIGLDHQEFLGDTKEEIAREKAGIIKPGIPCVTGEADPSILGVIKKACSKNNAQLTKAQETITTTVLESSREGQKVQVNGAWEGEVFLPLLGQHQIENLKVALAVIAILKQTPLGLPLSGEIIKQGVAATKWEGRLDVVSKRPLTIVDGAHNADGMNALANYLEAVPRRDVLVFGLKRGRKIDEAAIRLISMFDTVIVSEGNYQPQAASELAAKLTPHKKVQVQPNIVAALADARRLAGDMGTIVIAGSLYLVADALAALRGKIEQHTA